MQLLNKSLINLITEFNSVTLKWARTSHLINAFVHDSFPCVFSSLPWREREGNEEAPNICSSLFIRISSEIEPTTEMYPQSETSSWSFTTLASADFVLWCFRKTNWITLCLFICAYKKDRVVGRQLSLKLQSKQILVEAAPVTTGPW